MFHKIYLFFICFNIINGFSVGDWVINDVEKVCNDLYEVSDGLFFSEDDLILLIMFCLNTANNQVKDIENLLQVASQIKNSLSLFESNKYINIENQVFYFVLSIPKEKDISIDECKKFKGVSINEIKKNKFLSEFGELPISLFMEKFNYNFSDNFYIEEQKDHFLVICYFDKPSLKIFDKGFVKSYLLYQILNSEKGQYIIKN